MNVDRVLKVDAACVLAVGAVACVVADRLLLMSVLVPAVIGLRFVVLRRLPLAPELGFFGICTLVGAANDWNTVVVHDVYAYDVATWLPFDGAIPVWMLLFWGLILRLVASLARWSRWGATSGPSARVGLPGRRAEHPWVRLAVQLALVVATRQAIYRWFEDPLLSWLPFAGAALAWWLLLGFDRRELGLAALALTLGTAAEAALISVGGLHTYALGLVGGVPLWIILWWPLAVLIWKDVGGHIEAALSAPQARTGWNSLQP